MSDRLQELLRQRAAIQSHLAWLDREIAQARPADATPAASPAPSPIPTAEKPASPVAITPHSDVSSPDPDAILAGYRQDSQNLRTDLRKGCLLYFFGAFILLGLGVTAFYFVNRLIRDASIPSP
jgi:hypothetical protein